MRNNAPISSTYAIKFIRHICHITFIFNSEEMIIPDSSLDLIFITSLMKEIMQIVMDKLRAKRSSNLSEKFYSILCKLKTLIVVSKSALLSRRHDLKALYHL